MKRKLPPFPALRAFEAAARHGSFKLAAEELHRSQSAISHQVKTLEKFLGEDLFYRTTNGVSLTRDGHDYFTGIMPILDQLDVCTRRHRDNDVGGPLHVCSTPMLASRWLLKRIANFNTRFPQIELRVTTTIETVDFSTSDVDILLQYGEQTASGLRVEPFLASSRTPVCSPTMFDKGLLVNKPKDLLRCTLLRDVVNDGWSDWFSRAGLGSTATLSGPLFEHCELSLQAAETGMGIALAYETLVADEISDGKLVSLFDIRTPPGIIYSATCPETWIERPRIAAFRNWLFEESTKNQTGLPPDSKSPRPGLSENNGYVPAMPFSSETH